MPPILRWQSSYTKSATVSNFSARLPEGHTGRNWGQAVENGRLWHKLCHHDWSYESGAVDRIWNLVGSQHADAEVWYGAGRSSWVTAIDLGYMEGAPSEELRKIIAALMVYYLRQSGEKVQRFPGNGGIVTGPIGSP